MARKYVPIQHQFLKYYLFYKGKQYQIDPPDNWSTAQKEIARSVQYHGMLVTLSDQVEFSGRGGTLARQFYDDDGVIADVTILEYELDEDDNWDLTFSGTLDYSEFVDDELVFSVKINSQSLEKKLSSRYQTEVTLDSDTNLDGQKHGQGSTPRIKVVMDERDILGGSYLITGTDYQSNKAYTRQYVCVMFTGRDESYNGDIPDTFEVGQEYYANIAGGNDTRNLIFFNQQDIARQVDFDMEMSAKFELPNGWGFGASARFMIVRWDISEPDDDENLTWSNPQFEELARVDFENSQTSILSYTGKRSYQMQPRQGAIIYIQHMSFPGFVPEDFEYTVQSSSCNISGPVRAAATTNDAFLPYDFFKRMVVMIGGVNLDSTLLSQSRLALCNGYMIRNVEDEEGNKVPVSYTFEKLYSSFGSVEPLGLSVSGNTVKIEKRDYFYQDFLSKDFGSEITDVKIEFDKESAFSEISLGFETSNFSREGALKEFNVRSVWVSPINSYKKELNFVSNIQGSHNTMEKLRRVQYQEDVERTHTRQGDSTMYFLDLKDGVNKPRTQNDDFESIQNLPLSSSAFNLRLSPMNRLRNQGMWINFGYDKFDEQYLTFSSSTGATGMITKPIGENPLAEDQSIKISDIGRPKYSAEKISFQIPPQNLFKELKEKINGVEKAYGIFQLEYNNFVYFGYLLSYKFETNDVELQIIRKVPITSGTAAVIPPTSPPIIGVLSIDSVGVNSIRLGWTEATHDVGVVNYNVFMSTDGVDFDSGISVGNLSSYNYTGLESETQYWFKITALDASGGESSFSNTVNGITEPEPPPPLEIPTGITLREI